MARNSTVQLITIEYAKRFHECLVAESHEDKPTDIKVPNGRWKDLMVAMPHDVHIILGVAAIEHNVSNRRHWLLERRVNLRMLEKELHEGRSLVTLSSTGEMERSVCVTMLQVENGDGEVLVQVAQATLGTVRPSAKWKPALRIPSVRHPPGEPLTDSLRRLVELRFPHLSDYFCTFEDYGRMEEQVWSEKFGLPTDYRKDVFLVRASAPCLAKLEDYGIDVTTRAVPTPSANYVSQQRRKGEDRRASLVGQLSDISRVYQLSSGTQHGIYAFMPGYALDRLMSHEDEFDKWVAQLLPQFPPPLPAAGVGSTTGPIGSSGEHQPRLTREGSRVSRASGGSSIGRGYTVTQVSSGPWSAHMENDDEDDLEVVRLRRMQTMDIAAMASESQPMRQFPS
mmetsp:Transcript_28328/g.51519  ORF Transcript_28328/g.51519 Transcript_28328/m.51519 type:complete len:396 (+) Transcript_28328:17-1204(+)